MTAGVADSALMTRTDRGRDRERVRPPRIPAGSPAVVGAVALRPWLWAAAVRQVRVLAPDGWWRRFPFVPLPDPAWMGFRLTTAYGSSSARLDPTDVVVWLAWSNTVRHAGETHGPGPTGHR